MNRWAAVLVIALGGCELYEGDREAGGGRAIAPDVAVSGAGQCEPALTVEPCPPWWLTCEANQLRQSECRTACTTGDRICAGYDAGECFTDCMAYRYEAYCPM